MKKVAAIILICFAILLTACASQAGAATPVEPSPTPGIVAENYANALPVPSQLALGTIRLKGTANAVTKEDAANLLFLWKGLQTLSSSTSSSQLEVAALINQIQDAMKPVQLKAISEMQLTQTDVQSVMADLAASQGPARAAASGSGTTSNNNRQQQGGGQQFFPGGPGGAPGGGGGNNQNIPPSTQATIQARAAQRSNTTNVLLYTAVVNYLETVVAGK
jgi:hypothetical protein